MAWMASNEVCGRLGTWKANRRFDKQPRPLRSLIREAGGVGGVTQGMGAVRPMEVDPMSEGLQPLRRL
jgi:hypothetical protein